MRSRSSICCSRWQAAWSPAFRTPSRLEAFLLLGEVRRLLGAYEADWSVRRRIPVLSARRHIVLLVVLVALFVPANSSRRRRIRFLGRERGGAGAGTSGARGELVRLEPRFCHGDGSDRELRLRGVEPRPHRSRRDATGSGTLRPRVHLGDRPARIRAPGLGFRAGRRRQSASPSEASRRRPLLRAAGPPSRCACLRALCGHARVGVLARSGESDALEQGNGRPALPRPPG